MNRRQFITLVGGAVAARASRGQAQQPTMPTIGWLSLSTELSVRSVLEAFRSGLTALGYTEGKNIRMLYRYLMRTASPLMLVS